MNAFALQVSSRGPCAQTLDPYVPVQQLLKDQKKTILAEQNKSVCSI